jgi:probable LLM family oxidoreductase
MTDTLQFALDTFGDVTLGPDGKLLPHHRVLRDVVAEGVQADKVGIDVFSLGEHHRDDFAVSAPEVVLAAIAGQTRQIRLGTAVTVLSTDDPVRLFQRFSTLDAVSGGRAEVILGRGSFTESYGLFGHDLRNYEQLFEEKLDLFARLVRQDKVSWQGKFRSPLEAVRVYPPLSDKGLDVRIGVGGSPESVVRAVSYDMPMILAIIGGDPRRFLPFVDLYQRACAQSGRPAHPLGVHSPGHIARSDAAARDEAWEGYHTLRNRIGRERGWPEATRAEFEHEVTAGSMYVGSPETVARKIARTVRALGIGRFGMKYSMGTLHHAALMESIRLFGTEVIPMVREFLAQEAAAPV